MRAVVVRRYGGVEVLEQEDVQPPLPGREQVLIETTAAGLAFGDIMRRQGLAGAPPVPFTPGYDVVGRIAALGEGVAGWNIGQRVGAFVEHGGYGQMVAASTDALVAVPDGLGDATAVALVLNYGTAYQMIVHAAGLRAGRSLVVTSAAGGVGTAVLDIARALGIKAVGLASSAKHSVVRGFGGFPVDYRDRRLVDLVRGEFDGRGADAVLDGVGGRNLWRSRAMVAKRGRIVLFGLADIVAGGTKRPLGMLPTIFAVVAVPLLGGPTIRPYVSTDEQKKRRARYAADVSKLFEMAAQGHLSPLVHRIISLDEVADGHRELESGAVVGKIIIDLTRPKAASPHQEQ